MKLNMSSFHHQSWWVIITVSLWGIYHVSLPPAKPIFFSTLPPLFCTTDHWSVISLNCSVLHSTSASPEWTLQKRDFSWRCSKFLTALIIQWSWLTLYLSWSLVRKSWSGGFWCGPTVILQEEKNYQQGQLVLIISRTVWKFPLIMMRNF